MTPSDWLTAFEAAESELADLVGQADFLTPIDAAVMQALLPKAREALGMMQDLASEYLPATPPVSTSTPPAPGSGPPPSPPNNAPPPAQPAKPASTPETPANPPANPPSPVPARPMRRTGR